MKNKNIFTFYLLSILIYGMQGFEGIPGQSLLVYIKNVLGFDPSKAMLFSALIPLAWNIKPLWGAVIDKWLSKKAWILISITSSILLALILGVFPCKNITLFGIILAVAALAACWRDIALDGESCITGNENKNIVTIQSLQWGAIMFSGIIVGVLGGWIAEHSNYRAGFLSLIPLYIILGVTALFYREGGCSEKTKPTLSSYSLLFKDKTFIIVACFIFLYNFSPSFGTVLSYRIRDNFHWTEQFIGYVGAGSSVISLIGVFLFYKIAKRINILKWLYYSVFFNAIVTLCYLYYTPISSLVYTALFSVTDIFIKLLILTFMAQRVIKGLESTSFATLCGIVNLAGTCSLLVGSFLLPHMGYNNMVLISAGTSFVCLPLLNKLRKLYV